MVPARSEKDIAGIREACRIGRLVLDAAHAAIRPGVTTDEIDRVVSVVWWGHLWGQDRVSPVTHKSGQGRRHQGVRAPLLLLRELATPAQPATFAVVLCSMSVLWL